MGNKQECREVRGRIEAVAGSAESHDSLNVEIERHLATCGGCAAYLRLQRWSHQVLRAGEVEVAPPLMSAVWASIHRASEQAWDSALTRSFRYLLPYMVAVVALILLVGGLFSTRATAPVQAASTAFSILNSPETPAVAGVMTVANLPSQDPTEILGVARH
jgi:hypothetical protein